MFDKYVPTSSIKSAGLRLMWINSAALKSVKQKCKALMKYKATRLMSDFIAYTKYRNLSTDAARSAKFETYFYKSKLIAIYFGSMLGSVTKVKCWNTRAQ